MKRGPPYADANANQYVASQMQHMSAQRVQQSSEFLGRLYSFPAGEERQYASTIAEGQWEWDRDAQQMSPHLCSDGQGGNASSRSFYPNQIPDTKLGSNQESKVHPQEQDMEIGYEDNPSAQTLEGLEQRFRDDIMRLTKEQIDAEDAENARHKEKIIEINNQYQEKLSSLQALYSTRREEFLHKESQARLQQYHLAGMSHYQNSSGPSDMGQGLHGYGGAPGPIPGEPQMRYGGGGGGGSGKFDSYKRRPEPFARGKMPGPDTRVPTPGGRVYKIGSRYY